MLRRSQGIVIAMKDRKAVGFKEGEKNASSWGELENILEEKKNVLWAGDWEVSRI